MTYLLLNTAFLLLVLAVLFVKKALIWNKVMVATLICLLVTTAMFDTLIIWLGIVAYDESMLLGWRIGMAPVEDFFYAILAAFLVPGVWMMSKRKDGHG